MFNRSILYFLFIPIFVKANYELVLSKDSMTWSLAEIYCRIKYGGVVAQLDQQSLDYLNELEKSAWVRRKVISLGNIKLKRSIYFPSPFLNRCCRSRKGKLSNKISSECNKKVCHKVAKVLCRINDKSEYLSSQKDDYLAEWKILAD